MHGRGNNQNGSEVGMESELKAGGANPRGTI